MSIDFTTSYKYRRGTTTVSHAHKPGGTITTQSVAYCVKQSVSVQDEGGNWILSSTKVTWYLPANEMTLDAVGMNDTITDGSDVWTVDSAAKDLVNNEWQCSCTKQR